MRLALRDRDRVAGAALMTEVYQAFSGETEHPAPHEVIFADRARRAHARRWINRQSRQSAVRRGTTEVLVVAEALHETADADVRKLMDSLAEELNCVWSLSPAAAALLTASSPRLQLDARVY